MDVQMVFSLAVGKYPTYSNQQNLDKNKVYPVGIARDK